LYTGTAAAAAKGKYKNKQYQKSMFGHSKYFYENYKFTAKQSIPLAE
jgi:hypothetical protein